MAENPCCFILGSVIEFVELLCKCLQFLCKCSIRVWLASRVSKRVTELGFCVSGLTAR